MSAMVVAQAKRLSEMDHQVHTSPTNFRSHQTSTSSSNQEESFRRMILEKVEEGKRTTPKRCQEILEDIMIMLKHLTADVEKSNIAFRDSRPPFYTQEFRRLTDRIDTLTKARDTLTEYLHELETYLPFSYDVSYNTNNNNNNNNNAYPSAPRNYPSNPTPVLNIPSPSLTHSPVNDNVITTTTTNVSIINPKNIIDPPPPSSIHSTANTNDILHDDDVIHQHSSQHYPYVRTASNPTTSSTPNNLSTPPSQVRLRRASMTPSNFIRVHFPNKHTTALAPRNDQTLEKALESKAAMHSVTSLRAYTPVYMISRQACSWDIILENVLEKEIILEEKTKFDHSFDRMPSPRFPFIISIRCVHCTRRIREAYVRCRSCTNAYHLRCSTKAYICSMSFIQQMNHSDLNRYNHERVFAPVTISPKSRSLPRMPMPRPGIPTTNAPSTTTTTNNNNNNNSNKELNTDNYINYSQQQVQQQENHRQSIKSSFSPFSAPCCLSTTVISTGLFASSLFHSQTITSSSLPTSTSKFLNIPQLLLSGNDSPSNSPSDIRRPSAKVNDTDLRRLTNKSISEWEIRPDDVLNRGRMVGRGTYGTVYKAEVRLHGHVALKELNFVDPTTSQLQAFKNEVYALKKITHQNTLNFYGYVISPRFAIITQWCQGSTLYKHIHILDREWKITQLIDIARQICQGMSYLHDREIIHRDLKSSNIFLDMCAEHDDVGISWKVKIGDFGLATVKTVLVEGTIPQFQPTGSVLWMAPEVIQQKDPNCYSTKADVYSYGCVVYEMFSGKLPHSPITNKEQIMWLVGKGRLKINAEQCRDDTPSQIIELIKKSTDYDPNIRPNFDSEIDETLSKFECIFPRLQRSQSEPCLNSRRLQHTFVWLTTFGGFGVGLLRDIIFNMNNYVNQANGDQVTIHNYKLKMKQRKSPAFETLRCAGQYLTAIFYGSIVYYAFPEEWLLLNFKSLFISSCSTISMAIGVQLMGTLGPRRCSFVWPLLGAWLGFPFLFTRLHLSPSFNISAFLSCLLFEWKVDWDHNYFDTIVLSKKSETLRSSNKTTSTVETLQQKPPLKSRRKTLKRYTIFFIGLLVFGFFTSSAIYQNLNVDINGEKVKVKDVIADFFKSQAYQQLRHVLSEIWAFYLKQGLTGIWTEIWTTFDFESDKQAFELLELKPDADQKQIETRCKALARKWHPDRFRDADAKRNAEATFINIQQACDRLSAARKQKQWKNKQKRENPV
ncbi:unnamed protein product [Didymodactylos carnosus]|uniref:Uncharacterized protein n=1 Tax=Didymodactylos carnosus TaxID=1234261 RepID=A0A8S2GZI9_9BILA|nr:unnamed protein product [Didymodactylos carnosus]CAF3576713.1 unnamed protein product [Didymodactylos carnosus]